MQFRLNKRRLVRLRQLSRKYQIDKLLPPFLLYGGSMVRSAIGFLIGVMIARFFGVEDYGLFYTYMLIVTLSLGLLGESIDSSVLRFYTYRLNHDPKNAPEVLGSSLMIRALFIGPLLLGALVYTYVIGPNLLDDPQFGYLVLAGIVGGVATALVSFVATIYIAQERFIARAAILPGLNAVRCLFLGIFVFVGARTLLQALWLDVAAMMAFALLALWTVRQELQGLSMTKATMLDLLRFTGWAMGGMLSILMIMGLSAPFLLYFWGPREAGIFGATMSFAVVLEHAAGSIIMVQKLQASKIKHRSELVQFCKRTSFISAAFALALAPIGLFAGPLIPILFGPDFGPTGDLFPIVFASTVVHLMTTPLGLIFYSLNQPYKTALGPMIILPIWVGLAFWLIPQYAELGAVLSVLFARIIQGTVTLALVWHALSDRGKSLEVRA